MPLNNIPYNANQGEWYPYNADNYTDRARAMIFFNSLNTATTVSELQPVQFSNLINVPETNVLSNWPLNSQVAYSNGDPIYGIFWLPLTELNFHVVVYDPPTTDPVDVALHAEYIDNADNMLETNFERFDFEGIQINNTAVRTFAPRLAAPVRNLQRFEGSGSTQYLMTVDDLIDEIPSDFSYQAGVLEWYPRYADESKTGTFIEVFGVITSPPAVGSYITVSAEGADQGRYQITEYFDTPTGCAFRVVRVDGLPFPVNTAFSQALIQNITGRPRLKIRYRMPADGAGGGESPTNVYKIYSAEDADHSSGYKLLTNSSSTRILNGNLSSNELLFTSDERVFSIGGNNSINGPNLFIFPFGVPTTNSSSGGTSTRLTPWRKAYRSINRFNPREITFRQFKDGQYDGTIHYDFVRGPAIPSNNTESPTYNYPAAIPHRPPTMHINETTNGSNGRNEILITNKISSFSSTGTVRIVGGKPILSFDSEHWIDDTTDGFVLEESNNPNVMSFTANLSDTNDAGGRFTYDYTGQVSCKETVIPAYSGEILHFESGIGFVANRYSLPNSGGIASTAVFVDITETDEALRWNGSDYNPAEAWRSTFGNMTITNGTNVIELNNHAVLKTDKDHYVVIMYSTTDEFVINDGDDIQVTMASKQVIINPQANELPSSSEYGPIAYRPMNEEYIDDHRREYTEPSLGNFTITSDGTVDGNITINYDGDVPDGTQFRLYIQDDEEDTP